MSFFLKHLEIELKSGHDICEILYNVMKFVLFSHFFLVLFILLTYYWPTGLDEHKH